MGRKPPPKPPSPPDSTDWTEYRPDEPRYWLYGGPWVVPDDIPPQRLQPDWLGSGYPTPERRRKYLLEIIRQEEDSLERALKRYAALYDKGMEALEGYIQESWRQRVHTGSVKPGDPDPVSEQRAYAYRGIAYARGRIAACEAALDQINRAKLPLLFWKS